MDASGFTHLFSILLQALAILLAVSMIRISGRRLAWLLLSAACT